MPSERTSLILVDRVSKMSVPDVIGDVRANHGLDWMSVLRTAFWKSFGCARNNFEVRFSAVSTKKIRVVRRIVPNWSRSVCPCIPSFEFCVLSVINEPIQSSLSRPTEEKQRFGADDWVACEKSLNDSKSKC